MSEKLLNFLVPQELHALRLFQIFGIVALVMGGIFFWEMFPLAVVVGATAAIIFTFAHRLDWGVVCLSIFGFFHEWQIDFSQYPRFRDVPYLPNVNAPIVDIVAILLLVAFIVSLVLGLSSLQKRIFFSVRRGIFLYGLFIVSAAVSALFFMVHHFYGYGIKYLLRPTLFPWLMFWLLVIYLVREKKLFDRVTKIWLVIGAIISLYGLASLIILPQSGWLRVVPFGIHGFAPLGYNHNQIAEVLVALIPLAAFYFAKGKHIAEKYVYGALTTIMVVVALLTLSRAAWIVLLAEIVVLVFFLVKGKKKTVNASLVPSVFLALVPFLLYMGVFLTSSVVLSSTSARLDAMRVALFHAAESPLFGYGPGSFQLILADTLMYTMEYGEPLDAHGFIHKILLEEGVIGFIFFAAFLLWVLWFIWNTQYESRYREASVALFAMALGAILFQLFNTSYFNSVMWLPLGVATAGALIAREGKHI